MKAIVIALIILTFAVNIATASSSDDTPIHAISIPPTIQPTQTITVTPTPTPTPTTVIHEPIEPEFEITYSCKGIVTNDRNNCRKVPGFEAMLAIAGIISYMIIKRRK